MVTSMTGFGRGVADSDRYTVTIEVKSVNHRFSECFIRLPRQLFETEDKLKKITSNYIKRGKVDVFVTVTGQSLQDRTLSVDWELMDHYVSFLRQAKERYAIEEPVQLEHLLLKDELLTVNELEQSDEELEQLVLQAMEQAIGRLHKMRVNEGKELEKDLAYHLQSFKHAVDEASEQAPFITTKYKTRLEKRMKEYTNGEIDENKLITEVAIFAEKIDVAEEISRLKSHLVQFELALSKAEPIGRRLDFLTQEMNREVNTMGSKANDATLVALVVEMKSLLEKVREQVQNIE